MRDPEKYNWHRYGRYPEPPRIPRRPPPRPQWGVIHWLVIVATCLFVAWVSRLH